MKSFIGITCNWAAERIGRPELPDAEMDYIKCQYSQKIIDAGGIPIIIPNIQEFARNEFLLQNLIGRLDGIMFSGGGDIDPNFYGDEEKHRDTKIKRKRDIVELAITKFALKKSNIPILGICRGHQLLNVALGGNLWQDISQFQKNTSPPVLLEHRKIPDSDGIKHRVWHSVKILPNTRLSKIIGRDEIIVNSSHHQFVKNLGEELLVSATAPDNTVEALEFSGDRFVLSVQWHPEAMDDESSQKIFDTFVAETEIF